MRDSNGRRTSNRLKTAAVIWGVAVVAFLCGVILLAAGAPSWGMALVVGAAVGAMVGALMTVKKNA